MRTARILGTALSGVLLAPVAGCGLFDSGPSPEETASTFLESFAAGNTDLAAQQTDNPAAARAMLDASHRGMHPVSLTTNLGKINAESSNADVNFTADWQFGNGRNWRYPGKMTLRRGDDRWLVHWSPSVVHPKLTGGQTLKRVEEQAQPAAVLDRDGNPLMRPERLVQVNLDWQQAGDLAGTAGALAGALGQIDPKITQQSITAGARKQPPGQPYKVVTLREEDYQRVQGQIRQLPGVSFSEQRKLVTDDRNFGKQILSGVRQRAEKQVAAGAGWRVTAVGPNGKQGATFTGQPPKPAQPVAASLSRQVQQAAEDAVRPEQQPAMVVALKPSNGDILAVGQNQAANAKGPVAVTGRYAPGSTFKIITAAAGLAAGKIKPDQPVDCPPVKMFDGQPLPNDKNFGLGMVPERVAFAQSCNTSHGQLAADLPSDALGKQAKQLGVGADYDIPGLTTLTGQVPPGRGALEKSNAGIGQAKVLSNPFGMALAAASVANGRTPTPQLIRGQETKSDTPPQQIPQQVLDQLRPMMREVVTSGTGKSLAGLGDLYGKTGTAQFGDGAHAHGWFVGYRGDMAFAVLVADSGDNKPALEATKRFLSATP